MTKQRQLLQTVHTKLGDLLAFAALNTGVPVQDIDNIVVLLRMARQDEPESFNPVAKRLRECGGNALDNQTIRKTNSSSVCVGG